MTVRYENRMPSHKNALDIFSGQWITEIPIYGGGSAPMFTDKRISQFDNAIGGFYGKKVIELGPLDAGHTYAISVCGASEILAIEANQDAFLRCLVVKEIFGIKARFLCGDFCKYLKSYPPRVDVIVASGVLYHMEDPLGLIESMCKTSDQICIWSHYYDEAIVKNNPICHDKFSSTETIEFHGRNIRVARQSYAEDMKRLDFAGGVESHSYWIELEGITTAFDALGFEMMIIEKQEDHPHGPSMTFTASRR